MIQRAPTTAAFFSEEDKGTRRKTLYESSGASITIDTAGQNDLTFPRLDLCCKSRPVGGRLSKVKAELAHP
jgi:hypothetical protein